MPPTAQVEVVAQILVFDILWGRICSHCWLNDQEENSPKSKIKKAAPPAFDLGPWTLNLGLRLKDHIPNRFPYGSISHSQSSNKNSRRIAKRAIRPMTV